MSVILRKEAILSIFGIIMLSCSDPKIEQIPDIAATTATISFKGEQVVIPTSFPTELFNQTQDEFNAYYLRMMQAKNARVSGRASGITYEELLPILIKNNAKYPTITSEEGILDKDLQRILNDFPGIETHEEANEKRAIIYDYYQTFCKRDVVAEVVEFERARNGRIAGPSPTTLTTPEKNHLLLNPGLAQHYIQAANDVNFLTPSIFGKDDDDNNANAFKHSTWNALSIRFILKGTPVSENQAVDFTQDGTSKHEMNNDGSQKQDKRAAMDLHNNMSAREWMANNTSWGFGPFRKIPSQDDIVSNMLSKANASAIHPMVDILNWHGGNSQATWNKLYNDLYSPNQHLVQVDPKP